MSLAGAGVTATTTVGVSIGFASSSLEESELESSELESGNSGEKRTGNSFGVDITRV